MPVGLIPLRILFGIIEKIIYNLKNKDNKKAVKYLIVQGVSGKMIRCKEDEIVLRDREGMVCSRFQGPDFKTRLEPASKNIVVYVFTAPGIQEEHVSNGLQLALEILGKFGNGKDPWSKIFRP